MKNFFIDATFSLINVVAQSAMTILIAGICVKLLSVEHSAIWFLISGMIPFFSIFDFGLSSFLAREIGFSYHKKYSFNRINNLFLTTGVFAFIVLLIIGIATLIIFSALFHFSIWSEITYESSVLFSLGALLKVYSNVLLATLYGSMFLRLDRIIRASSSVVMIICSYFFLIYYPDVRNLFLAWLIHSISFFIMTAYFIYRKKVVSLKRGKFVWAILKRAWSPCLNWLLTALPARFIMNFNIYLVGIFLSKEDVIRYGLLNSLIQGTLTVASIPNTINVPYFSRLFGAGNFVDLKKSVINNTILVGCLVASLSSFIFFNRSIIFLLWTGDSFFISSWVLGAMLFFALLESPQVSLTAASLATGYTKFARIAFFSSLFVIIFSLVFIPYFGLLGVPISLILAQCLTCNYFNVKIAVRIFDLSGLELIHYAKKVMKVFLAFIFLNNFLSKISIDIVSIRLFVISFINAVLFIYLARDLIGKESKYVKS